jgi:hypothetical protein
MRKPRIWDILAWIVLAGIFIWLILKVTGVINTPILLQYSPAFGAVYLAGWAMNKLSQASDDIRGLKRGFRHLDKQTDKIEIEIKNITKSLALGD